MLLIAVCFTMQIYHFCQFPPNLFCYLCQFPPILKVRFCQFPPILKVYFCQFPPNVGVCFCNEMWKNKGMPIQIPTHSPPDISVLAFVALMALIWHHKMQNTHTYQAKYHHFEIKPSHLVPLMPQLPTIVWQPCTRIRHFI